MLYAQNWKLSVFRRDFSESGKHILWQVIVLYTYLHTSIEWKYKHNET